MTRKTLTIFEGPDGSGKTTAAKTYAESIGAVYTHFSAHPEIMDNELMRIYLRAMEPLLVERQHVVFDRSWISERPYGHVFRNGLYRLHKFAQRELENVARMFNPLVVFCNPGLETCLANYRCRKQLEMLDNEEQLRDVYHLYRQEKTSLPVIRYSYVDGDNINLLIRNARKAICKTLMPIG